MARAIGVALVALAVLALLVLAGHADPALVGTVHSAATLLRQVRSARLPQPNWRCLPPQAAGSGCAAM